MTPKYHFLRHKTIPFLQLLTWFWNVSILVEIMVFEKKNLKVEKAVFWNKYAKITFTPLFSSDFETFRFYSVDPFQNEKKN